MKFLNQTHKTRFIELFAQDGTSIHDNERLALFYLISGNDDLYYKRLHIYNFKKHETCFNKTKVDFSSGCKALVCLGLNLYNNYKEDSYATPYQLFSRLDENNCMLALNAIKIRFNSNLVIEFDRHEPSNEKQAQTISCRTTR